MWLKRWKTFRAQLHPVASRLAQEPHCRFTSYTEVNLAAELGFAIDVNQAAVDDWLRLPGISIRQAQGLERLRQNGVQLHCLEDLAAALGVSVNQLQPLKNVLSFRHYDPDSALVPLALNPNQATVEQLCQVPGLTPQIAQAIVSDRHRQGRFQTMADLQNRLGFSAAAMQRLVYYLRC
ncbi:MAG: helix-hairpin-helix domain-containing protein [Nodosilinea sp.]